MDVKILATYQGFRPLNAWYYTSRLHISNFVNGLFIMISFFERDELNNEIGRLRMWRTGPAGVIFNEVFTDMASISYVLVSAWLMKVKSKIEEERVEREVWLPVRLSPFLLSASKFFGTQALKKF